MRAPELNPYIEKIQATTGTLFELEEVFNKYRGKTAVVDLGCGNGHFLSQYLLKHPDLHGLGVEKRYKRVFKTQTKLRGTESHTLCWDVPDFVRKSPAEFWQEVWMQFPDPWPKKRHAKHRMLRLEFFHNVHRILKSTGRFCFVSDCEAYFEFLLDANSRLKLFEIELSCRGDLFAAEPSSIFKEIFKRNKAPIFSCEFRKLLSTSSPSVQ